MTLTNAGRLGIATSSPQHLLDVQGVVRGGTLQASGTSAGNFSANAWFIQNESGVVRSYQCGPNASTRTTWEHFTAFSTGTPQQAFRVDANNNFGFNSGYGGFATAYGCRAWVNFNGTGADGSKTIRGSGNVSSVTQNDTGEFTINFANAMPDANYATTALGTVVGGGGNSHAIVGIVDAVPPTSSSVRILQLSNIFNGASGAYMNVAIFR